MDEIQVLVRADLTCVLCFVRDYGALRRNDGLGETLLRYCHALSFS